MEEENKKKLTISDLNALYSESETCDQEIFSEQRSNVLLVAGEHYARRNSKFWNRIRDSKQLNSETKLRLTKNHIQKITKTYHNNIVAHAPSVAPVPANEKELADQKSAELHKSVWQDLRSRHKLRDKTREWAKDYIDIGEVAVKVFFDPNAGQFQGYEAEMEPQMQPELDEMGNPTGLMIDTGQMVPKLDENGQMVSSGTPVFSGDMVYERIFGFNLLRAAEAKSMAESRYLCYRKMVQIKDLKAKIGNDPDKLKLVEEASQDVFTVFDASSGNYTTTKNETMLREYYFRPCADYPLGYYYISTTKGILWDGELPEGIFPIAYCGFDEVATSPRSRSIIKQLRPYQVEVNRSASKLAEHQITLGDDKLLIQSGTKLVHGGQLPGVRGIQYSGMPPTILGGRSGEQYLGYMNSQISEMYMIANVEEDKEEIKAQSDPYTGLFRAMRQKKKFIIYAEKFESFLIDICDKSLRYAKLYFPENMLIPAIGKREFINMAEFKNSEDLGYQIKLEPQSDDIETQMGKQLVLNHALQYVGKELGKDGIGRAIRAMPFLNKEEVFGDLTSDYDNTTNDILAMDRGQPRPAHAYDNHTYVIKRLISRMKLGDFEFLSDEIKMLYQQKIQEHEGLEAENQQKMLAAQADMIPTGGYLVVCDFYMPDPAAPERTKRVRLPYEALNWLIKRLDEQGSSVKRFDEMHEKALGDIAGMVHSKMQQAQIAGAPQMPQQFAQGRMGNEMPIGG